MATVPHFEVVPDWERLPAGYRHGDVVGAAVDSRDRVFMLTRHDARCLVFDADGTFLYSFGDDIFSAFIHALTIDEEDFLFVVDAGDHTVRKFTLEDELQMTLGTPGVPSDTGYDGKATASIERMGPPFNWLTKTAIAPNGDIYVSDGYGNARIHRFSPEGKLLASWGQLGSGPGQFNVPHALWVAGDRVLVADRENDRIHTFSLDGEFLEIWDHIQRPTDLYVDKQGLLYIASLPWRAGASELGGPVQRYSLPGGVYVLDLDGNVLVHWAHADACAPGSFIAPHAITADSRGDIYVGEVMWTYGVRNGYVLDSCHTVQKFARL